MRHHHPLLLTLALLGTIAGAGQAPEDIVKQFGLLLGGYRTDNTRCFTPSWVGVNFSKTGVADRRRAGTIPFDLMGSYPLDLNIKFMDAKIKSSLNLKPVTEWEKNGFGARRVLSSTEAPRALFEIILPAVPAGGRSVACFGIYGP